LYFFGTPGSIDQISDPDQVFLTAKNAENTKKHSTLNSLSRRSLSEDGSTFNLRKKRHAKEGAAYTKIHTDPPSGMHEDFPGLTSESGCAVA